MKIDKTEIEKEIEKNVDAQIDECVALDNKIELAIHGQKSEIAFMVLCRTLGFIYIAETQQNQETMTIEEFLDHVNYLIRNCISFEPGRP